MRILHIFLFLILYFVHFLSYIEAQATVRYVSKTGTSTAPYTSWETAADSIQKCINYSLDGDTIIIANGVYHESLIVNKYLWLIGSSMDSTVIDGIGLADITVDFQSDGGIKLFTISGKGSEYSSTRCIRVYDADALIEHCKITNADYGIGLVISSSLIQQCLLTNVKQGIGSYCIGIDTCKPKIINSVIYPNDILDAYGIRIMGAESIALNNLIIINAQNHSPRKGIGVEIDAKKNVIKNNIVVGFRRNIEGLTTDTAFVQNNVSSYAKNQGYEISLKTNAKNNISAYNETGTVGPTPLVSDYNLYWQNNTHTTEGIAEQDIIADPMFVNDTIPVNDGTYDYHLQMYSPAIDAGDPTILDVDGSRSDIGMYGGPEGESYTYQNLAPKPPQNCQATYNNGTVEIRWDMYSEADFSHYNIYRSTVDGFEPGYSDLYSSSDTSYFQDSNTAENEKLYYRITVVDSADNESVPGDQISVTITGVDEGETEIVKEYRQYQNYPNPYNPVTTIPFKIKERGYVKVMVYDIKGEILTTLVNETKETGYYEVDFKGDDFASGIYLYRIEVIGEGNIPVFVGMKKMMLLK